jgi:hypothetical protein
MRTGKPRSLDWFEWLVIVACVVAMLLWGRALVERALSLFN